MNWYNKIRKAMPLPRVKLPSEEDFTNPDHKDYLDYLVEKLDSSIPDETEDSEGDLEYLGNGAHGIAYVPKSNAEKVVKYTRSRSEFESAELVLEWQEKNGGFHPCIVGVYSAEIVPNSGVYRLVTERVKVISSDLKNINIVNIENEHDKILDLNNKLRQTGFFNYDIHEGNVGMRDNGDLVFLDLGGIKKP